MVKNKIQSEDLFSPYGIGAVFDLKNLVIIAPLLLIAVSCLSFAQMKAVNTQNNIRREAKQNSDLKPLPLIVQPDLPTLDESVEIKTPEPVPPPVNQYIDNSQKQNKIGPSSTNSGNALQPNSGNQDKKVNDDLQATRRTIRLEEAKF